MYAFTIGFHKKNSDQKFSFINVIRNISPVSPGVIVIANDFNDQNYYYLYFIDCIFQENQNDLFYNSNYCDWCSQIYYLLRCWIQHTGNWQNRCNNGWKTESCIFVNSKTQTHSISYFDKEQCDPGYIYHNQINSPCQTFQQPPSPTNCEFHETEGILMLSSILGVFIKNTIITLISMI